jgi:NAD(P)-dependent dehydrogenase (short-subunit alcohol dehydrogenase family)
MAKIFITGSADGLGQLAARALIAEGHQVVLHARNNERGQEALNKTPGAEGIVIGDLSSIEETKILAAKANDLGAFDAVIHNAGIYTAPGNVIFSVNVLAPYILSCLMNKPKRLIYLSSDMHQGGHPKLDFIQSDIEQINYSDSKLHVLMLAKSVARKWPDVYVNAVHPGWVPTKMGGAGAPDSLEGGFQTQVWLAVSNDEKAKVSGRYFFHKKEMPSNAETDNISLQNRFLNLCSEITGISFPE